MSYSAEFLTVVAVLALAGCTSASRRNTAQVPDWAELETPAQTVVHPGPALAAPPSDTPGVAENGRKTAAPLSEKITGPTWVSLQRWSEEKALSGFTRLSTGPGATYLLRNGTNSFAVTVGSASGHFDGIEVRFGFAPQMLNGEPCVHALDLKKTIAPLLEPQRPNLGSHPIVVLDPGHGGENAGTRSVLGNFYEKDYTLDWALRLRRSLAAQGWQVFLTRENDSDLALSNRVTVAEQHKADLFLSLHFNSAAPNEVEAGLETYCLTPAGLPSSLVRNYADDASLAFPNNGYDGQNVQLAVQVHRALLAVNGHRDRGVRRARFPAVLRGQQRPAILVEGGYLSNHREARLIADPAYRQKLADAVAGALLASTGQGGFSTQAKATP